jgi:hypothetical protein
VIDKQKLVEEEAVNPFEEISETEDLIQEETIMSFAGTQKIMAQLFEEIVKDDPIL